jgi:hypothetical protein
MSTGLKANNDGSAAIQVGGTDYITISSTGAVAIPVSLTVGGIAAGGNYALVQYTSPTTWDATAKKAAGLKAIKVTVVGAGGAGGGSVLPAAGTAGAGAGGGGGGAAIEYVPAANITPGTKTVTAGPGTNSFGPWGTATPFSPTATASATAGSAGGAGSSPNTQSLAIGAGGTGSGGALTFVGVTGSIGTYEVGANRTFGGTGGSAAIFAGSSPAPTTANGNGFSSTIFGAGGSGAPYRNVVGTSTGGTGAPGIVIIEEFY